MRCTWQITDDSKIHQLAPPLPANPPSEIRCRIPIRFLWPFKSLTCTCRHSRIRDVNSPDYDTFLLLRLSRPLHELLYALMMTLDRIGTTQGRQDCTKAIVFGQMVNEGFFRQDDVAKFEALLFDAKWRNLIEIGDDGGDRGDLAVIWLKLKRVDGRFV